MKVERGRVKRGVAWGRRRGVASGSHGLVHANKKKENRLLSQSLASKNCSLISSSYNNGEGWISIGTESLCLSESLCCYAVPSLHRTETLQGKADFGHQWPRISIFIGALTPRD